MELIDKKAALKAIYLAGELIKKYGGRFYEGKFYGCQSAYEIINDMPTVEERKHGRWIHSCCSICNARLPSHIGLDYVLAKDFKYCYNCGAIMDDDNNVK